jgi:hypothetical protein
MFGSAGQAAARGFLTPLTTLRRFPAPVPHWWAKIAPRPIALATARCKRLDAVPVDVSARTVSAPQNTSTAVTRRKITATFCGLLCLALGLALSVPAGRATTVEPPEFSQMVNGSDCIVRAVVKSVSSVKKVRARGVKIFTEVELEIVEVIAGNPPAKLTLEMLGGQIGQEELVVSGAPRFQVGDEDILFVSGNGRNLSPLYGMMHGRYPILKDAATGRAYVARSNHVPLHDAAEVSLPMTGGATAELQRRALSTAGALTPEDFIRQIRANARPPAQTQRAN